MTKAEFETKLNSLNTKISGIDMTLAKVVKLPGNTKFDNVKFVNRLVSIATNASNYDQPNSISQKWIVETYCDTTGFGNPVVQRATTHDGKLTAIRTGYWDGDHPNYTSCPWKIEATRE